MRQNELLEIISNGESSKIEFKSDEVHANTLAEEIVAFANFEGGTILIGVDDFGAVAGCGREDIEEFIVNAVCHRDYTISGAAVRLFLFNNRLEIRSPGGLPNTLTVENMLYRQFTRNQMIASFLTGYGYMERRGKGILRMIKLCQTNGILCDFSPTPDKNEFVVTYKVP